ncbi:MAG: PleD family two-component system response regulator [Roseovarius sp.]
MHLLAVDDEPAILDLLELLITQDGRHTLSKVSCVVDALGVVADPDGPPIDCFLIDIQMPGTNGIDLCHILRDRPDHRLTPIVMLTAMSDKASLDQAFAAGASDFIPKPFGIDDLRHRITLIESLVAGSETVPPDTGAPGVDIIAPGDEALPLHAPFHPQDIDGVIDHRALHNYVAVMARKRVAGSVAFAIGIDDVADLHARCTAFEFECLVTDICEAISILLDGHQFLVAYAGNGEFLCVVEDGWRSGFEEIGDRMRAALQHVETHFNDGRPMNVTVATGDIIPLEWTPGNTGAEALAASLETVRRTRLNEPDRPDQDWTGRVSASG